MRDVKTPYLGGTEIWPVSMRYIFTVGFTLVSILHQTRLLRRLGLAEIH